VVMTTGYDEGMEVVAARKPRYRRVDVPRFEVTERDCEILRLVARHRFIRSKQIVAVVTAYAPSSSGQQILRRLELLFHGGYLTRPQAQNERFRVGGGSEPMTYCLGNKGSDLLAERFGFRRAAVDWTAKARTAKHGEIEHALEVTDFMVGLELACSRRRTLRIIHLDEILNSIAPEETRKNPKPYFWPVSVRWRGKASVIHPIPDQIFGIQDLNRPEGRNRKFFFAEMDRGTMPAVRLDLTKTSFLRKLLAYGYTYQQDLHTAIYGFPNVRVLTVTRGRQRIESIIAAHKGHTWQLCSPALFLFADRASLLAAEEFLDFNWIDGAGSRRRLLD
jgi:hypothetical protein